MTDDRLPLADLLAKAWDGDFLRSVAAIIAVAANTEGKREIVELHIGRRKRRRSGRRS